MSQTDNSKTPINVFIAYAHENDEHNEKVIAFVDSLRRNGIDANMDRLVLGHTSSANMYMVFSENLEKADKVIVILSKGYKEKFNRLQSGVRFEGELIVSDRREKPNKYILGIFTEDGITESVKNEVVPFCFSGVELYPINNNRDSLDTIIRKIYDVPEYDFSEVGPTVYIPQSKAVKSFAGEIRKIKKSKSFEFNTLYFHTIYSVGEDRRTISYEVFRCIQVTCMRLTDLEIRPQFQFKVPVRLTSAFVSLPEEIGMDDNRVARFSYPVPADNKEGDIISIHYKMSMVYPEKESVCRYTLRSENDSLAEIHDVVLSYRNSARPAKLTKLSDEDLVEGFVKDIPFDEVSHCYRFTLQNPPLNTRFSLSWDDSGDEG